MDSMLAQSVFDYVLPNEQHIYWTVMIVLYPYITGLVAGAFIVSSLYHVFGRDELKPIARFALFSSFVFLCFATMPLLFHLGRPERAFNIMITPHFTSAMAGFGFIYLTYMVILVIEIWFLVREDLIKMGQERRDIIGFACRAITLFDETVTEETHKIDHRVIGFFAALGIPVACILHGYVGFLFGSIKANPWWSTSLMFPIFILSAIVSGISVLIMLYNVISWVQGFEIDTKCMNTMASYLWGFMIVDVVLELLELLTIAYQQTGEWEVLHYLINHHLFFPYIVLQLGICSLLPFLMLGANAIFNLRPALSRAFVFLSSILLLLQVLAMRWNVVIGGGMISKSMRGFTPYFPGILEKEGLLPAAIILTIPFALLYVIDKFLPFFANEKRSAPAEPAQQ